MNTNENLTPTDAQALAHEAYIFAFPMVENYKTMFAQALAAQSPYYRAPFNQFAHSQKLLGPEFKNIVRPNNDTMYSAVWLDLRAEPLVLCVPAIPDRYYSFQLVDMYTFDYAYIGTRATGTAAGSYLLTNAEWSGETPAGIAQVFRSEGNFVFCLGRTAVSDEADLPNVLAIQQQYKLEPLSAFLSQPAPTAALHIAFPPYNSDAAHSLAFIPYFNFLLGQVAIHPSEVELIGKFGRIGIGANRAFDPAALDAEMRDALNAGVAAALDEIKGMGPKLGVRKNGWTLTGPIFGSRDELQAMGNIASKYAVRAAAAFYGLYGNPAQEAYYPTAMLDAGNNPLDGAAHNYVLKFAPDAMPQVNAFWSMTMYNLPEQLMVENPIRRYSIGDRTKGLQYNADGSLEIYIQHESPDKELESNWLPAPDGQFSVTMRMYLPKFTGHDFLYAPPGIRKQ